jgi:hypothetical protein
MSYHRRGRIISRDVRSSGNIRMSGVTQATGLPVARIALAGTPRAVARMGVRINGTSLGADETTSIAQPTLVDPETKRWQADMLTSQKAILARSEGDRFQKWVQIAATVMIPVSAAIWRAIGVGRRRPR